MMRPGNSELRGFVVLLTLLSVLGIGYPQTGYDLDPDLIINARAGDPLYSTYAAPMSRSRLYGDKAYKMDYYQEANPLNYSSDQAGRFYLIWKFGQVVVDKISDFYTKPVVTASFPDMALLSFQPWPGIIVEEIFTVYSSKVAFTDIRIKNMTEIEIPVECYPVQEQEKDSVKLSGFSERCNGYVSQRYESKKRLISNLYAKEPYPTDVTDIFAASFPVYSYGAYPSSLSALYNTIKTDFYAKNRSDSLNMMNSGYAGLLALHGKFTLKPGEEFQFRILRGIQDMNEDTENLMEEINAAKKSSDGRSHQYKPGFVQEDSTD